LEIQFAHSSILIHLVGLNLVHYSNHIRCHEIGIFLIHLEVHVHPQILKMPSISLIEVNPSKKLFQLLFALTFKCIWLGLFHPSKFINFVQSYEKNDYY
jgi:hypothetical protein